MTGRVHWQARRPGWHKPPGTVYVGRPSRWGNPFDHRRSGGGRARVVTAYRSWLRRHPEVVEAARAELAGRPLGCWCPPGEPCHADVLLEVAGG
ncbi:DUF4326 domain-containing protein [Pseudonocardia zijingensis]|jgi:hypothetical protein|uniref:DUF4326 domain-containing protein n=1 Tax=Pseudonocardia zijingensis TaxID=153376 RepID=A0ABP4BE17_9PSEU